jgi:hypothetical protein
MYEFVFTTLIYVSTTLIYVRVEDENNMENYSSETELLNMIHTAPQEPTHDTQHDQSYLVPPITARHRYRGGIYTSMEKAIGSRLMAACSSQRSTAIFSSMQKRGTQQVKS